MDTIKKYHNDNHNHKKQAVDRDACFKSPEWAEHARYEDDDQPCDDGRAG